MENLTKEQIEKVFEIENLFIKKVDEKKDINNGMIITFNPSGQVNYFHSYILAYEYFLKMGWFKLKHFEA